MKNIVLCRIDSPNFNINSLDGQIFLKDFLISFATFLGMRPKSIPIFLSVNSNSPGVMGILKAEKGHISLHGFSSLSENFLCFKILSSDCIDKEVTEKFLKNVFGKEKVSIPKIVTESEVSDEKVAGTRNFS